MKKIFLILAVALAPLFAQSTNWYTKNPNADVFEISTAEELRGLAVLVNGVIPITFANKTVILKNDIDLEDVSWTPIGSNSTNSFRGIFDGQGYTISRLLVSGVQYAGLFGYVTDGQIKEVNVVVSEIIGTIYSGGLVGYMSGSITNSYATGDVYATDSYPSSSFYSYSGGLVGYMSGSITNSYATGNVYATSYYSSYSGGLVGYMNSNGIITSSYATGNVYATNSTSTSSSVSFFGGLVGFMSGSITNSYAMGSVSPTPAVRDGPYDLYSGSFVYGGLVGSSNGSITNSYAAGNVYAKNLRCHSFSSSCSFTFGGIFGRYNYTESSKIVSVYYNSERISGGIGEVCNAGGACGDIPISGISGKTSTDLKKKVTFENWDFNETWNILENSSYEYPYLISSPPTIYITSNSNNNIQIEYIFEQNYTSKQINPEPVIQRCQWIWGEEYYCSSTPLTKGIHYELSYGENINAGTGTITVTGKGSYSDLLETINFTIMPKKITLKNASAQNKIYDGTTMATIIGELEGVIEGDDILFDGIGTFADANANYNKAVTSAIRLTGKQAKNYILAQQPTNLRAEIFKKTLTITLNPKTTTINILDNIPNFQELLDYDGFVGEDSKIVLSGTINISHSYVKGIFPAGIYPITLYKNSLSAINYTFTFDNMDLQLVVIGKNITDISTCTVSDIEAKPYTSNQITPAVSVNCEGSDLTENTDYTVSYGTNRNAGTNAGSVIITGKGDYENSLVKYFTITQKALTIDNAQVQNKTYDGTTTATITGTLEGIILGDEVSIIGTFASKNAGNREISEISLIGIDANNYSLTKPTLTGTITAKALASNAIQTIASQTYTGADITPAITVKDGDNTLTSADYNTPIFSSNRNAGSATVSISGKGNYTGTATATFTITAKTLTNDMIESIPAQAYANGNAIEPMITVKFGTRELIEPRDYSSAYSNNTAPGYATVTITGTGNYTGIATANFLVTAPKDIEDLAIAEIADQTHTGNAITPVPTITDGNYTLVLDQDFVIDGYQNNIAMGNARVIVSGIGTYSGTRQITFKIVAGQIVSDPTPTLLTQMVTGKVQAYAANNAIVLQNLPKGKNVQIYNLKGELISSKNFNQVNQGSDMSVEVQTKGMYIVKVNHETLRIAVK